MSVKVMLHCTVNFKCAVNILLYCTLHLYLGGILPDYGYEAVDTYEVVDPHFTGCLSGVAINSIVSVSFV